MANKIPTRPYLPGNVPDTPAALIQFLFDELYRIAAAINPFPVSLVVKQIGLIVAVTPVPTTVRLFIGSVPVQEYPGGAWDPGPGEWVNPVSGLYTVNVNSNVEGFGTGNKLYQLSIQLWEDNHIDPPSIIWATEANGPDDRVLSVQVDLSGAVLQGSSIYAEATVFDDQFSGNVTLNSHMSIALVGELSGA
jgi:hypothetical protein